MVMDNLKVLIDEKTIHNRIKELADQISKDFKGEEVILVCVLKGAIYFATDLSMHIKDCSVIMDFVKASSYGNRMDSSGVLDFSLDLSEKIKGRNVIIVEDIIDSGITLNYLYDYFKRKRPKSLKICALLDKPARRVKDVKVDYTGFVIENKFVIGYGMDYDEKYRNIPFVGYKD